MKRWWKSKRTYGLVAVELPSKTTIYLPEGGVATFWIGAERPITISHCAERAMSSRIPLEEESRVS